MADADTHPIVVHCLAGKDRTGVVVALVLALLGVPDETVAEDYALSNLAMAALRARAEASRVSQLRSPAVSDEVFSAKPSNIATLFAALAGRARLARGLRDLVGGQAGGDRVAA